MPGTWLMLALSLVSGAEAAEADTPESAWEALEMIPPRASWHLGLHVSYGTIAHWRNETQPWVGFGVRGGGGKVYTTGDRLGGALTFNIEGPIPLHYSTSFEPAIMWDRIIGRVQVGASAGPALMMHSELEPTGQKHSFGLSPMVAFRLGYSEPWSQVGRRFFIVLEPKYRYIGTAPGKFPDVSVSLVVGTGQGL